MVIGGIQPIRWMTDLKKGIAILFKSLMCKLDLRCDISDILKHIHLNIHKRNIKSKVQMSRDMIYFQQCGMCDQQRLRSACAYTQSDQSLCLSLDYSVNVKLLTAYDLECLSVKRGCTGSSESTLVKTPHCWKSHVAAQMYSA